MRPEINAKSQFKSGVEVLDNWLDKVEALAQEGTFPPSVSTVTIPGDLVVSGAGPRAFGGSALAYVQTLFTGAFTPSVSGGGGFQNSPSLTLGAGYSGYGIINAPTLIEAASGVHTMLAGADFRATYTNGAATATDSTTVNISTHVAPTGTSTASSLRVEGGSTGGSENNAILVESGITRLKTGPLVAEGPNHSFGNNTAVARIGIRMNMAVVGDGASDFMLGVDIDPSLTMANGDTSYAAKLGVAGGTITTQDNSETIGLIAGVRIVEPDISKGASDTITVGASLYVYDAPTEATDNYAVFSDSGLNRFDGDGTDVFELPADATDPTSGGGAATGRIPVKIGGSTVYIPYY